MSVNLTQALNSESYAKKCWINYYYQNNSMGITAVEMGKIAGAWSDYLGSWKTYAETDHTRYDIDDSDYDDAVKAGRDEAKSYNKGSKGWQITRTSVDGVVAVGGNTIGKKWVNNNTSDIEVLKVKQDGGKVKYKEVKPNNGCDKKIYESTTTESNYVYKNDDGNLVKCNNNGDPINEGTPGSEETVANKNEVKTDQWDIGLLIACAFDVATAAMYRISKPNHKQKDAVDTYAENMGDLQNTTCSTQDKLISMDEELINYSDEAASTAENANTDMSDARTLYQFHADTIEYFEKAKTAGHNFTQDEIDLYQESVRYMAELNEEVGTTQEEAESTVQEIHEDMKGYEDDFDASAEDIGYVEGFTEEASKVDESTQVQCYIEGVSQGINAAGAAKDGYEAITFGASTSGLSFGATAAYIAAGGLAVLAGISDGFAAAEQFKWASETGDEIDARKGTQDLNAGTLDLYNQNNDYYQGYMENVEGLNVIRPDDMSVPPDSDIPVAGQTNDEDDPNKKKK